jgi:hypothetical protein
VFDALWSVVTDSNSTKSEREHASAALVQISLGITSMRRNRRYTQKEWDDAFTQLLERERKREGKSETVAQWLEYLHANWSAVSSGKPPPP